MTAYIIQVVMFQLLFLLVYETLLKKETFFTWNRMYLLVTAIVSLLLPLIKIEALTIFAPAESFSGITTEWLPEIFIGNAPQTIEHPPAVEISAKSSGINWWLVVYSLGVVGSILLVFKKYKNLERLFRFKTISAEKEWRIIEVPNSTIACTFYRTIFLGDQLTEVERQQILSHELVHVKQKHSLDLVFFEILKIIFWFNPLIYIYQNRIATLHEFIADAAVVKNIEKRNYYEQLLNSAFNTHNISFINQFFNHSLIKKRIIMIQRTRSKTTAKVKYLALLPLVLLMLSFVAYSGTGLEEQEHSTIMIPEELANQNDPNGKKKTQQLDIPFAVVDQIPVYSGCEAETGEAAKECFNKRLKEYVDRNFNLLEVKPYLKEGTNRLMVVFTISSTGEITDVKSRMTTPGITVEDKAVIEKEAIRVVQSIPKMKPGNHDGKEVGVSYALPIQLFNSKEVN